MRRGKNMENLAPHQISAVSRLFSSSVIKELGRKGASPVFARLAKEITGKSSLSSEHRVSHFYETSFDILKKTEHRHEYIYKSALTQRVLLGKHSLRTASMMSEFRVGPCKADIVILNGTATVYEIKSERDSLARLEQQIENYRKVFSTVYVIAGDNHVAGIKAMVSRDVGILTLSARHQISTVREAEERPSRTSPGMIFGSIRIEEAKQILRLLDRPIPNVPNTEMYAALKEQFVKLSPLEAHAGMVHTLKMTRNLQPLSRLLEKLPPSLHSAAMTSPIRPADHERLLAAVNTSLTAALRWG